MSEEEMRGLFLWLVESKSLGPERAAILLFRIWEALLCEKKSAKSGEAVYNQEKENAAGIRAEEEKT